MAGDSRYRTMGTVKMAATAPLKSNPSFTSIARLDISVRIMEFLSHPDPVHWLPAGQEVLDAGQPAMPQRQRFLGRIWDGQARLHASRVRQTPAVQLSRWSADLDRLLV